MSSMFAQARMGTASTRLGLLRMGAPALGGAVKSSGLMPRCRGWSATERAEIEWGNREWVWTDQRQWASDDASLAARFPFAVPDSRLQFLDHRLQPPHELRLRGVQPAARLVRWQPGAAVHLGVLDPSARAARPLGLHRVAADRLGVGVALPCPRMDRLARLLPHAAERQEGRHGRDAGFLDELADGRRE